MLWNDFFLIVAVDPWPVKAATVIGYLCAVAAPVAVELA